MKNAVPINASYFAVQAVLDIYRTQEENMSTYYALRAMMKLFSIQTFPVVKREKLLKVQSVDKFIEFVQGLSSETINFYDDEDFKALEIAEKLKLQLKKLELIRILSDQMLQKKDLVFIFLQEA